MKIYTGAKNSKEMRTVLKGIAILVSVEIGAVSTFALFYLRRNWNLIGLLGYVILILILIRIFNILNTRYYVNEKHLILKCGYYLQAFIPLDVIRFVKECTEIPAVKSRGKAMTTAVIFSFI